MAERLKEKCTALTSKCRNIQELRFPVLIGDIPDSLPSGFGLIPDSVSPMYVL